MAAERSPAGPASARLFVALELPEAVVAALLAWRAPLLGAHDGLRGVPRASLHATLCFLGWLGEDAIEPVGAIAVETAREAHAVPGLALAEPLWLPRRRPRVLAVGLADREGALGRLQGTLAERLADGGWHEPEARPYLPHVTVARVRGATVAPGRVALGAVPELTFAGAAVTLYRSLLHPSGARYELLSRHVLA